MKTYNIYVYQDGEFKFYENTSFLSYINELLGKKENAHKFFRVDDYTICEHGKRRGEEVLQHSDIYLSGIRIYRRSRICTVDDLKKVQEKQAVLYKVNGEVVYYADIAYSIPEIKDIMNLSTSEWYTMKCVKDEPERYVVLFYDWESFNVTKKKILNKKATERFNTELFGDVLFINENFIA